MRCTSARGLDAKTIRVLVLGSLQAFMHRSSDILCKHKIRFSAKEERRSEPLQGPTFETSVQEKKFPERF
jgi:hypothetical protein